MRLEEKIEKYLNEGKTVRGKSDTKTSLHKELESDLNRRMERVLSKDPQLDDFDLRQTLEVFSPADKSDYWAELDVDAYMKVKGYKKEHQLQGDVGVKRNGSLVNLSREDKNMQMFVDILQDSKPLMNIIKSYAKQAKG